MATPDVPEVAALIRERDEWKREALAARERELLQLARLLRATITLRPPLS